MYFSAYIKENYATAIENVGLNPEEVYNLIQSRNRLNEIIYPDNIETFRGIEKQLLNEGFFNKKGTWVADKQDLIGFILQCELKGYLKIRLNSNNRLIVRRFFENRYLVDINKIFQPNQIDKLSHLSAQFNWIKKAV